MAIRGQVKWFDPKKGYGFIIGPQGQDVFVHYSQIQGEGFRSLKDGETVEYELVQGEKGWQARSVQRLGAAAAATQSRPISSGYTRKRPLPGQSEPSPSVTAPPPATPSANGSSSGTEK